jgi:hypothetical protein
MKERKIVPPYLIQSRLTHISHLYSTDLKYITGDFRYYMGYNKRAKDDRHRMRDFRVKVGNAFFYMKEYLIYHLRKTPGFSKWFTDGTIPPAIYTSTAEDGTKISLYSRTQFIFLIKASRMRKTKESKEKIKEYLYERWSKSKNKIPGNHDNNSKRNQ